jgi:predicted acetyltransferase
VHIDLTPATREQESVVANLLELYAHDFSEFHNLELGADGRFGYASLPLYWSEPDRYPFLVQVDGRLAGFALVKSESGIWDLAEFFIARAYRRRGIGMAAAHQLWGRFPGIWQVRVLQSNRAALNFWQAAVTSFSGVATHPTRTEKDDNGWYVFTFEGQRT